MELEKKRIMREKVKILIVEDDTPSAMLMTCVLSHAGCDVQVARTEEKGMELARERKFDLIALDVDINGFEICSELKQRHISRHTPIVLISDRSFEEDSQRSLEVGAVDYITKPFEATEFIFRIHSHIEHAKNVLEVAY